jgi:AraC-like DNA-binding protein
MKAILQKVPVFADASFAVREFRSAYFDAPWHFHPEHELVLIVKGEGKRFVGDCVTNFGPGDLVLLGANLPHWYRSEAAYYQHNPGLEAVSVVVQFTREFLGKTFLESPEMARIRQVLESAALGMEIRGRTRERITGLMSDLMDLSGMDRLLRLLSILNVLADSDECVLLSNSGAAGIQVKDSERINRIYEYVMSRFTEPITIEDVADRVHMCPSAFCRYFKKRTRKTFSFFLNEIRIGHACRLIVEGDRSVTEVCFLSGFNNVSYFNRQFKAIKKVTPSEFRHAYFAQKAVKV